MADVNSYLMQASDRLLDYAMTPFGERVSAEFTPLIELDPSNGLSLVRRDTVTTTNSGAVTNADGEHKVSTGTTTGSTAALRTKERGRYQPGILGLPGIGIRRPTAMTGDQEIRWGYFDDDDGFYFGEDSTGVFIQHRHGGTTDDKVYQEDWNGEDRLRGFGPSGVTLDLTKVSIFRFPYLAYGGGPIVFEIVTTGDDGEAVRAVVHRIGGLQGESILSQWKLPVNAEADNGTTTDDVQMYVGGRHFAVVGRYNPNRRVTPEARDGVSVAAGTTEPIISFRKKSDRTSIAKSIKVFSGSLIADQDGRLKVYLDASLTGASWGSVSEVADSETAVESDTSATALSGGTLMLQESFAAANGNKFQAAGISVLGQDLPDDTAITLAFENTDGSNAATVAGSFSVEEEWAILVAALTGTMASILGILSNASTMMVA